MEGLETRREEGDPFIKSVAPTFIISHFIAFARIFDIDPIGNIS